MLCRVYQPMCPPVAHTSLQPQAKRPTKVVKSDTYLAQVTQMSDGELVQQLRKFGEDPGPITDTTKGVYQRKLAKHLAEKTLGAQEDMVLGVPVLDCSFCVCSSIFSCTGRGGLWWGLHGGVVQWKWWGE